MAATLLGTTRSVWIGGLVTLAVVSAVALLAPKLRELHLEPQGAAHLEPQGESGLLEPVDAKKLASQTTGATQA